MIATIQNKLNWHLSTWLIISLIALNLLDFETTLIAIEDMGMGEANPLLDYFIMISGTTWSILWFKAVTLGFLFLPYMFWLKYREKCQTTTVVWALGILNIYYSIIVISNLNLVLS